MIARPGVGAQQVAGDVGLEARGERVDADAVLGPLSASAFVSCTTAALLAAYEATLRTRRPTIDAMLTTVPPWPAATIARALACATRNTPDRLTSTTLRQSSSGTSRLTARPAIPCVVDDDVGHAELGAGLGDGPLHAGRVGDVELEGTHVAGPADRSADLGGHGAPEVDATPHQRDLRPCAARTPAKLPAEAAEAAGDDGGAPAQVGRDHSCCPFAIASPPPHDRALTVAHWGCPRSG